jgi:hypothetical protein
LKQAAEDANGLLDQAETDLYQKFPQDMIYMSIHSKSTLGSGASRDDKKGELNRSTPHSLSNVRITKVGGHDFGPKPGTSSRSEEETLDEPDEHYLDLATRGTYTAEDLVYGCQKYGDHGSRTTRAFSGRDLEQDVIYRALRERQTKYDEGIRLLFQLKGKANKEGRFHEADDLRKKLERTTLERSAAGQEVADCLFAHKNPQFVAKLFGNLSIRAGSATVQTEDVTIDLHLLHVKEAEDRTSAVLEIAAAKQWKRIKIITGKGLHSKTHGESLVRGAIERHLKTHRLVQSHEDLGGSFVARVRIVQN